MAVSTLLITGSEGQLGHHLSKHFLYEGRDDLCLAIMPRERLDITDGDAVMTQIGDVRPEVVINCAGYTDTLMAEREREKCWRSNTLGPMNLAKACAKYKSTLIHISSDFIYGRDPSPLRMAEAVRKARNLGFLDIGEVSIACTEQDVPAPTGYCGFTKLAGEHAIMQTAMANPGWNYWILRTGGLFEEPWRHRRNFPYTVASRLKSSVDKLPAVTDVFTSICYAPHLVKAILWFMEQLDTRYDDEPTVPRGTYHVANQGGPSWFDVARRVANAVKEDARRVVPITAVEFAKTRSESCIINQAHYTVLDTSRYEGVGGPLLPHWTAAIDEWGARKRGTNL